MLLVFAKYGVLVNPLGIPVVEYEQVSITVGEGHHAFRGSNTSHARCLRNAVLSSGLVKMSAIISVVATHCTSMTRSSWSLRSAVIHISKNLVRCVAPGFRTAMRVASLSVYIAMGTGTTAPMKLSSVRTNSRALEALQPAAVSASQDESGTILSLRADQATGTPMRKMTYPAIGRGSAPHEESNQHDSSSLGSR